MVTVMHTTAFVCLLIAISTTQRVLSFNDEFDAVTEELTTTLTEVPEQATTTESNIYYISNLDDDDEEEQARSAISNSQNISVITRMETATAAIAEARIKLKNQRRKNSAISEAIKLASLQGFNAMIDLYDRKEPEILRKGEFLDFNHPAVKLSLFSAPMTNETDIEVRGAFASLFAAKKIQQSLNLDLTGLGRQTAKKKVSLKRTQLESFCPPRDNPQCLPATKRYRTHDGTCNNFRKPRWGSAQMPFHRFLPPNYADGIETVRGSARGGSLPSARFISLVVHGYREEEAPITMILPQWGQLIDHDLTATLQPRSINGSIPRCCQSQDLHPSCMPISVPRDDPFLGAIGVRCLEFLRSSPAQRRDCLLSWREQTNQVTSFIDASPVYSSNPRTADGSRIFRDGLLLFGRGPPREDACLKGGFNHQCIRAGDTRAGEQPGLLAMHTTFVAEHNRLTLELTDLNPHWSDEKLYQETRRIIGAIFQHITFREFLPLVLGKEVCRLFDLELEKSGYYHGYDHKVNPFIANSFSAAAFRFGHSLIPGSLMRSDMNYRFLTNNVSLHEESAIGDIGSPGSLHRIIRGLASQRTLRRDEFMSPELTNHLFQSGSFPFGMDLAAINIQRGRDHGIPSFTEWRKPCGLSEIRTWEDLENVVGPNSANRIRRAYDTIEDVDLFVGGISERPVIGGLVGPTFACIIAQQFSNLRRGDRFWYENPNFESSFTPAQLFSIRQVTLSQILCRQLGSSNFFQPHAFLPPDFPGNDRVRCGQGNLAPMNLNPWLERDPFQKENDINFNNHNFIPSNDDPIKHKPTDLTATGNIDLNLVQVTPISRPNPSTTNIDNKVDFTLTKTTNTMTTSKKPKKKKTTTKITTTTTTRKPSVTIIDNKIDFKRRSTKKPVNAIRENIDEKVNMTADDDNGPQRRSDEDIESEAVKTKTLFVNEDNATRYYNNRPVAPRLNDKIHSDDKTDTKKSPPAESRIELNLAQQQTNSKRYGPDFELDARRPNYDYDSNPRPSSYYPIYPPLTQTTSRRPVMFQNNRPSYDSQTRYPQKPTGSPISSQFASTPFSYDVNTDISNGGFGPSSSVNYDQMSMPIFVTSNRYTPRPTYQEIYSSNRPNYYTTRRSDGLSTFMYVETTRKSPSIYFSPSNNVRRTSLDYQLSISTPSSSIIYSDDSTNPLSVFISNTNKLSSSSSSTSFAIKRPITSSSSTSLLSSISKPKPQSVFSSDKIDTSVFDGLLNPDTSYYIPNKKNQKPAYVDYSKYDNTKLETTTKNDLKFVYLGNVLHKYYQGKNKDVEDADVGLYDPLTLNRYAANQADMSTDNDMITTTDNVEDVEKTTTTESEGRSKRHGDGGDDVLIVPFKLLTRIDRPDNWIHKETDDKNSKNPEFNTIQLPQVPDLQQNENVAKELPRPLLGKKTTTNQKKLTNSTTTTRN